MTNIPFGDISSLEEINIGDNFIGSIDGDSYFAYWFTRFFQNIYDLTNIKIGKNAIIEGTLAEGCSNLTTVKIGDNAKLLNFTSGGRNRGTFSSLPSIQYVELGKGTEIGTNTFLNCTNLKTITLYLTEEQKADNSKIPTSWQANVPNATFTSEIDNEKIVWHVTYAATE